MTTQAKIVTGPEAVAAIAVPGGRKSTKDRRSNDTEHPPLRITTPQGINDEIAPTTAVTPEPERITTPGQPAARGTNDTPVVTAGRGRARAFRETVDLPAFPEISGNDATRNPTIRVREPILDWVDACIDAVNEQLGDDMTRVEFFEFALRQVGVNFEQEFFMPDLQDFRIDGGRRNGAGRPRKKTA